MSSQQDDDVWKELDRLAFIATIVIIFLLLIAYFLIAQSPRPENKYWDITRTFLLDVIPNLLPTFLLVAGSYALIRRIQTIRERKQADLLSEQIASKVADKIFEFLATTEPKNNNFMPDVQLSEEDKIRLNVTHEFEIIDKYFNDNSDPQKIIVKFINRGSNIITIDKLKFSATNDLPRSSLLSSYRVSDGGRYFIIPFKADEKEVSPGQSFIVEIGLAQKWDARTISGMFGSIGYLKPDVIYGEKPVELFYTI